MCGKGDYMLDLVYVICIGAIVFSINYKYDINLSLQLSILSVVNCLLFILYLYVGQGIQDLDMAIGTIVGGLVVSVMSIPFLTFVIFKGRDLRKKHSL